MQVSFAPLVLVECGLPLTRPREQVVAIESPSERAERFRRLLASGRYRSQAELARELGCSQAWVSKVLGKAKGNGQQDDGSQSD